MKTLCVVACAMAALVGTAFADEIVKAGDDYAAARKRLIAAGWRAMDLRASRTDGACVASDVCETYPEAEDCAGSGLAACSLMFSKPDGTAVRIVTVGEDPRRLEVDNVQDPPIAQ